MARALRQALLAPLKALQFCSRLRFKCRQISACRHSGKPFKTYKVKRMFHAKIIRKKYPSYLSVFHSCQFTNPLRMWCWGTYFPYCIHINAIGVWPSMLEVFLKPLPQGWWYLVETNELFDPQQLCVVTGGSRIKTLNYCWNVPKYAGIHEGWKIGKQHKVATFCSLN